MLNLFKAFLRGFLVTSGAVLLLTNCTALRNALTPPKVEVIIHDTIVTESVRVDTTVISSPIDTLIIENEKIVARVVRSYDTIQIQAECKSDTLVVTQVVEVPAQTIIERKPPVWFKPAMVALVLIVLFLSSWLFLKALT